jgi:hypothetical protein
VCVRVTVCVCVGVSVCVRQDECVLFAMRLSFDVTD